MKRSAKQTSVALEVLSIFPYSFGDLTGKFVATSYSVEPFLLRLALNSR
ncbi:hypothetical protein IVA80_29610 [Bradyrhizobium sp. 139]|nr:hypothetical protein [Bradyrhizobium sp. 139]MCK1744858.1 hypothetical protein [Bradyrhizobium sp. 139]